MTWNIGQGEYTIAEILSQGPRYLATKAIFPFFWRWCDRTFCSPNSDDRTYFGELYQIGTDEDLCIPLPDGESHPPSLIKLCGEYHTPAQYIREVSPARLVGPQPLTVAPNGEILMETAESDQSNLKYRLFDYLREHGLISATNAFSEFSQIPEQSFDIVFPLVRYTGSSYYHWMLGFAYKVRALEHYREVTGADPTVLLEANAPSWVDESLELLGCDIDNCTRWGEDIAYADTLIVPSHNIRGVHNYNPSVQECEWIAQRMRDNAGVNPEAANDARIYISRADADQRHVRNEAAVESLLNEFGFESHALSDLAVSEQVRLFSRADIVVGPHGAGFTNFIFSEDPTVMELFPESRIKPFFYALAAELGYEYEYLICDDDGDANILVDLDNLRTTVNSFLSV